MGRRRELAQHMPSFYNRGGGGGIYASTCTVANNRKDFLVMRSVCVCSIKVWVITVAATPSMG